MELMAMLDPVPKTSLYGLKNANSPYLETLECVSRSSYIVVARRFLFSLQNLLAKIKVVELGASLLTERVAPGAVRVVC